MHQEMSRAIKQMTDSYESVMNRYDVSNLEPDAQRMPEVTHDPRFNRGYTPQPIIVRVWRNAAGQIHRLGDLPAIIHSDGSEEYYVMGNRHRDNDEPAVIWGNASKWNTKDRKKEWWTRGKLNRANGQPAIMRDWHRMSWYVNGELHRDVEKGPADISTESYTYYLHGVIQPHLRTMSMGNIGAYEMDMFFECNQNPHSVQRKYWSGGLGRR
jgi:hypothetical protein